MTKENCLSFAEIETAVSNEALQQFLLPIEEAISYLPKYEINDTLAMKVRNGAVLATPDSLLDVKEPIVMLSTNGEALAIYMQHPSKNGFLKPSKILKVIE
jgi:tRNA pseudouridine55 synthase